LNLESNLKVSKARMKTFGPSRCIICPENRNNWYSTQQRKRVGRCQLFFINHQSGNSKTLYNRSIKNRFDAFRAEV